MKIKEYEFEASIELKHVIAIQKHSLKGIKKELGEHSQVVELFDNTIRYLELLQEIMKDSSVLDKAVLN